MTYWISIATMVFSTLLSSCGRVEDDRVEQSYLQIVGRITPATVQTIENAPDNISRLVIRSQGGETKSAIEAARLIRDRGYDLVIEGYCLSACAQWIMPAATRVRLEGMPIVGMHHTATAFEDALLSAGEVEEAEKYAPLANLEQQFYAEIGVDEEMLLYPYAQTIPLCYFPSEEAETEFAMFAAKWNYVALSRDSYIRFTGKEPAGRWPEERSELIRYLKQHIPAEAKLSIVAEDRNRKGPQRYLAEQMSKCEKLQAV